MQGKSFGHGGVSWALSEICQEAVFVNIPLELFMDAYPSKELLMGRNVEFSISLKRAALYMKQWTF